MKKKILGSKTGNTAVHVMRWPHTATFTTQFLFVSSAVCGFVITDIA